MTHVQEDERFRAHSPDTKTLSASIYELTRSNCDLDITFFLKIAFSPRGCDDYAVDNQPEQLPSLHHTSERHAEGFRRCRNIASSRLISGRRGWSWKFLVQMFSNWYIFIWGRKSGSHAEAQACICMPVFFCIAVGNKRPLSLSKCQISYQHLLVCCCGITHTHALLI